MMHRWQKGQYQTVKAKVALNNVALRAEYEAAAHKLGLDAPLSIKTQMISMEYDFWKQHREDLPRTLQAHLKLGKQRKLLSTYFNPLLAQVREWPAKQFSAPLERDYEPLTVHPHLGVAFTETGRWSCWRPNLQNQPKSIRKMYRSPYEGHLLVSADYKSLEMYTAVEAMHQLGITGPLRKLLDEGGDIHANTAKLMGITRQEAKIANFALLGGMGVQAFHRYARSTGVDWGYLNALDIRTKWLEVFWDCAEFLQLFKIDPWNLKPDSMRRQGWLELNKIEPDNGEFITRWELGRKLNDGAIYVCTLPTGRTIPNRRFSQAANIFFQGLGADVISQAFHLCCCHGLRVCIIVHDSITVTAPKEEAENAGRLLAQCMQQAQQAVVQCGVKIPLPEYEIGDRWS
jgi:DNA polymerase I-like protein with 3'-5' exonuclease and polymerase domains